MTRKSDKEMGREIVASQQQDLRGEAVDSLGNAPSRGLWLINRERKRVYGQVIKVRRNGSVEWENPERSWVTSRGRQKFVVSTAGAVINQSGYEYSPEIPSGFSFIDGTQPEDFDMTAKATTTTKKPAAKKNGKAKAKPTAKRKVVAKPQSVAAKLKAKASAKVKAKAAAKKSASAKKNGKATKKTANEKKSPKRDYSSEAMAFVRKNPKCTTMQVANALAEKYKDLQSSRGKRYKCALDTLDTLYADGRLKYRNAKTSKGRTGVIWTL